MMSKLRIFSIALIICIIFLSACNNSSEKPTEIGRTGAELEKMQVLKEVQKDYRNSDKHYRLGKLYQQEGQWGQADHEFRNCPHPGRNQADVPRPDRPVAALNPLNGSLDH